MVIVVMMGAVVMMAIAGMMFYVKNATDYLAFIVSKGSTREMTEDLIGSVLNVYSQPLEGSTCDPALITAAVAFRDLTLANPPSFTWDTNPSNLSNPPTVTPRNCLISAPLAAQLDRVAINITPLPTTDDLPGVRRELRIEVRLQKKKSISTQAVIRHYALTLLSLDRFGSVFNSSLMTAFDVDNSSQLVFDAHVLHSNKTTPFNVSKVIGYPGVSPLVVFKQAFSTLASSVNGGTGLDLSKFNSVFEKGITTGAIPNARYFPTTYAPYNWSEPVDYHYVYSNSGGIQDLSPLPRLSGSKTSTNGDGHRYNNGLATVTTFPHPSIITKLAQTCEVGASGSAISKVMVLYRDDAEVTLDFGSDSDPLRFCAMMKVKKLTVRLQSGKSHYIFGKVYFDEIKVTGGGTLYIVDPELDTTLSQSYDGFVNMTELRRDLKTLEVYIGNPFYQPINSDLTKLHVNYGHKMPSEWFSGADQKDLAGATIAPGSEACDTGFPSDYCWPNYMRSYRRHIEATGQPNISVLFQSGQPYNKTLIFNVLRTL